MLLDRRGRARVEPADPVSPIRRSENGLPQNVLLSLQSEPHVVGEVAAERALRVAGVAGVATVLGFLGCTGDPTYQSSTSSAWASIPSWRTMWAFRPPSSGLAGRGTGELLAEWLLDPPLAPTQRGR
ncbi:MAG: hypothetical protein V9G08_13610 [Dermatophilaceae bacterium]